MKLLWQNGRARPVNFNRLLCTGIKRNNNNMASLLSSMEEEEGFFFLS